MYQIELRNESEEHGFTNEELDEIIILTQSSAHKKSKNKVTIKILHLDDADFRFNKN